MNDKSSRQEEARLDALLQLRLLDTPVSESFDRITRMAAHIFGLSIAAISLTDRDRQWFKSRLGVPHDHIPRSKAPCSAVACTTAPLVLPDLLADPVYADSGLANDGIRFYAGAPLITRDGYGLGALCVLGTEPRQISSQEMASLLDLAAMVMAQIELQHAYGRVDPISGLPNRNQFLEDLEDLARDRAGEAQIAVLIDLAGYEEISNLQRVVGSSQFEEMVPRAAQVLRTWLGHDRNAYHVAAAQFAFLAPADTLMENCLHALGSQLQDVQATASLRFITTVAIGVIPFALGELTASEVLRVTHSAAQDARDRDTALEVYSPDTDKLHRRRLSLIHKFGNAIEQNRDIRLVYQPRLSLATGECLGVEALLRWKHPILGNIPPGEFIPAVERTALGRRMTDWVMSAVMHQAGAWRRAGIVLPISFNVSACNLQERDLIKRLELYRRMHDVPVELLEVELTESAVMGEMAQARACVHALADTGIRIAIDDFGTGYSSLAYLQALPATVVKIDRSFVMNLDRARRDRTLMRSMIRLSQDLGYRVVAEGVETETAVAFLQEAGCDEAQGYLFGRPMAPESVVEWRAGRLPGQNQVPVFASSDDAGSPAGSALHRAHPRVSKRRDPAPCKIVQLAPPRVEG